MRIFNKLLITVGRLAMMECALLLGLWVCASDPADAQWQTPTHSVPVGKGAGVTGFNSVGPCALNVPIVGGASGITSDPVCSAGGALGTFAFQNYATPPAIGGTTPNTGDFSTLTLTNPLGLAYGGLGGSQAAATANQVPVFPGTSGPAVPTTITPAIISNLFANPSASIGLTANNGIATTAMRSDATPALSQAIIPTWTGLHSFTTTAGGINMAGNPNISQSFSGVTVLWGLYSALTANSATTAESAAHFGITSTLGSGSGLTAYKNALSTDATCNSGSAYCWAEITVLNVGAGGTIRGGVGKEIDWNNNFGNYTGSPGSPYGTALLITGTNTGGYGSCAICVEFGGTGTLWQAALHGGPIGKNPFNTAFIWDESDSPIILKAVGSHTDGINLGSASFSGNPFSSAGFIVDASGNILGNSAAFGGGVRPSGVLVYSYASANSLQIETVIENDNNISPTAALGFSVTAFTAASETRSSKGGIGYTRGLANGRGALQIFNRATNDTSSFTTSDVVATFSNAGGFSVGSATDPGAGGILANASVYIGTAANTLVLKRGANGSVGTFVCTSGGTITITNSYVAITDTIIISLNTVGGTISTNPTVNGITAATSFTAKCATSDTSTYNYAIIKNAAWLLDPANDNQPMWLNAAA